MATKPKEPLHVSLLRKLVQVRAENEALKATIAREKVASIELEGSYKDDIKELQASISRKTMWIIGFSHVLEDELKNTNHWNVVRQYFKEK